MDFTIEMLSSFSAVVAIIALLWSWLPPAFLLAAGFSLIVVILTTNKQRHPQHEGNLS